MIAEPEPQRVIRLTPLADLLNRIAMLKSAPSREAETGSALGRILAQDVTASAAVPAVTLALRDGWAVRSELTQDASAYAPIGLATLPTRLDAGEVLPSDCDAVLPLDAVETKDGQAQLLAPATPGDGVLPAGADATAGQTLRRAGQKLRVSDLAVMATLGIATLRICEPRIRLVHADPNRKANASVALLAASLEAEGTDIFADDDLEASLRDESADAVITVGGTGAGLRDNTVSMLARHGELFCHGVGLMPGDMSAFGFAGKRPVLMLPGRIDAALAGWLVLGRALLGRLSGRNEDEPTQSATLMRKVTSTIGIADVVPVRRNGDAVEPLGIGTLPHSALTRADGWILIAPDSEGYPAGATVIVRPFA